MTNGENFVVFHNDSDSSYMNTISNFRGAEIGAAQEIIFTLHQRFQHQAMDLTIEYEFTLLQLVTKKKH